MSRDSNSLELSQFFENDDSDGYRLAEFLQKRRGCAQRQNVLFMNYEPLRLSVDVQVEKVPERSGSKEEQNNRSQEYDSKASAANIEECANSDDMAVSNNGMQSGVGTAITDVPAQPSSKVPESLGERKPTSPLQQSKKSSPRFSAALRKSGGYSPADHLRRYSLKRLSRISGRRTLLQEFENTVTDSGFAPNVCSTPMSPEKRTYTIERGQKPGQVVLTPEKSPAKQVEYHGRSEFSTHNEGNTSQAELQKIESSNQTQIVPQGTSARDSLSKLVESARSVLKEISQCKIPNSSIKRQILHDKSGMCEENGSAMDITLGSQNISCSSNRNVRSPQLSSSNRSQVTIRLESPRASLSSRCIQSEDGKIPREPSNCLKLNGSQIVMTSKPAEMNQGEIPNTQHVDISVLSVANGEETVIPETQDFRTDTDNCITVQSSAKVVVIPVNQTFNTTLPDVPTKLGIRNSSENLHSTRTEMIHPPIQEHVDDATDNLRLTDIMTDDDEPTAVEMCVQNSSQTPMNLAANTNNVRAKRLRKRSLSRRRVQMERSQVMSTETETEQPPLALNNHMATRRRNPKKRQIPLNKAPGTPLNGERFAVELARMSNYEILDLRKRNSMGRVFPVNGRKSSRSKGQAIKKQIQLDDEIELELLKRNMETNKNDNHQCVTVSDVVEPEVYPPVPDEFRDALTFRGENISDSSLVDEKSCDRVSFRTRRSRSRQQDVPNKIVAPLRPNRELVLSVCVKFYITNAPLALTELRENGRFTSKKVYIEILICYVFQPEVLQHYLEVSNKYSQKKKKSFTPTLSKPRSLYTQGLSDSEDRTLNSSQEKHIMDKSAKKSLPCVPSPPRSDSDRMTSLKVVSPPPPLQSEQTDSPVTDFESNTHLPLPLPPPQFGSDSGIESNATTNERNASSSSCRATSASNLNTESEEVFKKPLRAPPKRRGRKNKAEISSNQVSSSDQLLISNNTANTTSTTDTSTNSTLRRSKRGHVPLKNSTPLFQLLFQKVLGNTEKKMEKKQAKEKKRLHENSKSLSRNASAVIREKKPSTQIRKREPLSTVPENVVLEEVTKSLKTKGKVKGKVVKEGPKRKTNENDEALECSRIKLSTPPPLDHFNNVFDTLRNTTNFETPNEKDLIQRENPIKEKKLRVRVARVKQKASSRADTDCVDSETVFQSNEGISPVERNIQTASVESSSVPSSSDTNNSNFELLSWLKNITDTEHIQRNDEIFKEMRISSASSLCFTELQGVEYAFYDTDDKASLGYLRFKPKQVKPRKRAKKYHLHFVTLVGHFRITANDKERKVGPGDMVAIEKSVYYDIENLSDDIGILMVIKK